MNPIDLDQHSVYEQHYRLSYEDNYIDLRNACIIEVQSMETTLIYSWIFTNTFTEHS